MSLFAILPVTTGNIAAPVVPSIDVQYLDGFDSASYEHWMFDRGTSADLTGKNKAKVLTLQGAAPAYARSYLTIPGTSGQALLSDVVDAAGAVDTICAVVRRPSGSGSSILLGNFNGSAGTSLFLQSGNLLVSSQGLVNSGLIGALPNGAWNFIAVSRDFSGATKLLKAVVGATTYTTSGAVTYLPNAAQNPGAGNPAFAGGATSNLDFAELRYYTTAKSLAEIAAIYADAKTRMALRGIAVL